MPNNNIGLDIEKLLSKLRGQLATYEQKAADVQQHIDLVQRGQLDLFAASKKASKKIAPSTIPR